MAQISPQGGLMQGVAPALPEQAMPVEEAPPQKGQIPLQSDALKMDEEESNNLAIRIERNAKKELYGEMFDDFMEIAQQSENIPETAAVFVVQLLGGNMQAIHSSGKTIPYDHLLDVAGEITSEVYDALVQTGIYSDASEEELERNQAVTVTMAVGGLAQRLSKDNALPGEDVARFMDNVASGQFDEMAQGDAPRDAVPPMPGAPINQAQGAMAGQAPIGPSQAPIGPSQAPNQPPVDPNQMNQGGYV